MTDDVLSRVPPHDLDAEAAVLGAVMTDPDAFARVGSILRPESFYSEAHRRTYEAAEDLSLAGSPIDLVQVATWLRDHERLAQVGGISYLTGMLNSAPAVANVEAYAKTVAVKHRLRRMILVGTKIQAQGYANPADGDDWLDRVEQMVHEITMDRARLATPDTMRSALARVFTKLQAASSREGGFTGTPTGFEVLDEATGGLHDGEQTTIAGRPAMGKTAFAMAVATNVARRDLGVVVFSEEMPNEQLATRTLCSAAKVDVRKARTNRFDRNDWSAITAAVGPLSQPKHYYLVEESVGLLEMRSIVRARQSDMTRDGKKLGLVVVDYLQLMPGFPGSENNEQAVAANARGLKRLAKECGCPVLVLSQLNRGVEQRGDKRPMLADLRESGAIEEAADCVVGMYRDDYYNEKSDVPGTAELIILKQRNGPTGTVSVGFKAPTVTFENLREDPTAGGRDFREYVEAVNDR